MNSPQKKHQKLKESSKDLFDQWRDHTTIKSGDTSSKKFYKVAIRILGVLLIILFSPLILLILLVAVLAAL